MPQKWSLIRPLQVNGWHWHHLNAQKIRGRYFCLRIPFSLYFRTCKIPDTDQATSHMFPWLMLWFGIYSSLCVSLRHSFTQLKRIILHFIYKPIQGNQNDLKFWINLRIINLYVAIWRYWITRGSVHETCARVCLQSHGLLPQSCLETMCSCLDPSVVAPALSGSLHRLVNCLKNLVNNFKQSSNLTHSLKPSILKGSSTLLFKPGWTVSSTQYKTTTYTILFRHKLSEVLVYEIAHRSAMKST